MACHLLLLLLPECATHAEAQGNGACWMDLIQIATIAIGTHITFLASQVFHDVVEIESPQGRKRGREFCSLSEVSGTLSSMLVTILRDVYLCPPFPCKTFVHDMPTLRLRLVYDLLDCIPYISQVVQGSRCVSRDSSRSISRGFQKLLGKLSLLEESSIFLFSDM